MTLSLNRTCRLSGVLASAFVVAACATAPVTTAASSESLRATIDRVIAAPEVEHAVWGILVEDASGRTIYARNADVLMTTASNRKLFISALTYECFPLDTRIPTEILTTGEVRNGVLEGDLVIRGHGDPSLAGRYDFGAPQLPVLIAAKLRQAGVTRIHGRVLADVSSFDDNTIPGSWKVGNLGYSYAVPTDALAWNENVVGIASNRGKCLESVTTDPWFVNATVDLECTEGELEAESDARNRIRLHGNRMEPSERPYRALVGVADPALYAAQAIDQHLRFAGFEITEDPQMTRDAVAGGELLLRYESPFLSQLLGTVLKNSQNLYAETLFKRAATALPRSYSGALAREAVFLTGDLEIDRREYHFSDGSGLSPEDRVSPRAILRLLRHMAAGDRGRAFSQLLAAPGEEGTLRRRLTEFEGRLHAKTGTIHGVAALSGWVDGEAGERRFFAILVNQHTDGDAAVAAIDKIAREIARF